MAASFSSSSSASFPSSFFGNRDTALSMLQCIGDFLPSGDLFRLVRINRSWRRFYGSTLIAREHHPVDLAKLFFERQGIQPPASWPFKVSSIHGYRFDLLPKECTQHLSRLFPALRCVVIHYNQIKQATTSNIHAALAECKQLHTLVFEDDLRYFYAIHSAAIKEFTTNSFSYPHGLKTLVLGSAFAGSLGSLRIPSSVETLCVGGFDNQQERMLYLLQHPDQLIETLHYLPVRWFMSPGQHELLKPLFSRFNETIRAGELSAAVRHLHFGHSFDQPLIDKTADPPVSILPSSLETFGVGYGFNEPLPALAFAKTTALRIISLGTLFDHPIHAGVMPESLEKIYMSSSFARSILDLRHCTRLTHVLFPREGKFIHPLRGQVCFPPSIRVLHLPELWDAIEPEDPFVVRSQSFWALNELRVGMTAGVLLMAHLARLSPERCPVEVFPSLRSFDVIIPWVRASLHSFNPLTTKPKRTPEQQGLALENATEEEQKILSEMCRRGRRTHPEMFKPLPARADPALPSLVDDLDMIAQAVAFEEAHDMMTE